MPFDRVKIALFVPSLSPFPSSSLAKLLHFKDGGKYSSSKDYCRLLLEMVHCRNDIMLSYPYKPFSAKC